MSRIAMTRIKFPTLFFRSSVLLGFLSLSHPARVSANVGTKEALDRLAEQTLGKTTLPAHVKWRLKTVELIPQYHIFEEFNSFVSSSYGLQVRVPLEWGYLRSSFNKVIVNSSTAAIAMSQTRYRQWGFPNRLEYSFGAGLNLVDAMTFVSGEYKPNFQVAINTYFDYGRRYYPGLGGAQLDQLNRKQLQKLNPTIPAGMQFVNDPSFFNLGLELVLHHRNNFVILFDSGGSFGFLASKEIPNILHFGLGVGYAI